MITTIYLREEISCAHKLHLPYKSKCKKIHGHNYLIEIWITGEVNEFGMVVDFSKIKEIIKKLDHRNLNNIINQPTAENISIFLINEIKKIYHNILKIKVRVWEDRDSYAETIC